MTNEDDGLIWDTRLDNAAQRGYFLENDKWMARNLAMCSLGEKYGRNDIEKLRGIEYDNTMELYEHLSLSTHAYGDRFCGYVQDDDINGARRLHEKIKGLPLEL